MRKDESVAAHMNCGQSGWRSVDIEWCVDGSGARNEDRLLNKGEQTDNCLQSC